jgi:HEPN domain-containing protein
MCSHDAWFIKAQQDLKIAKLALKSQDPLFDMIVYHAQQCVEKVLKGFFLQ